jgi:nitric oxide reductase NorQ protein
MKEAVRMSKKRRQQRNHAFKVIAIFHLSTTPTPSNVQLIDPKPMRGFVKTQSVLDIEGRALNYLRSGFPIHFRGPTGTGKTTLALHIARKLRRPVVLIHGDAQFTSVDLTGKYQEGYDRKRVVDEFVRGVSKTEERMSKRWSDQRITVAVRHGYTLLYDEFTRSKPEANNILLSILQEGVLDFPIQAEGGESYLRAHPNFRAIFTSNPEEYAGVHKSQDALLDRMVTLDLEHYDRTTEVKIIAVKSRLPLEDAERIIDVARGLRNAGSSGYLPSIRGCIMVAKSVKRSKTAEVKHTSRAFRNICSDVFIAEMERNANRAQRAAHLKLLDALIDRHCGPVSSGGDRIFTVTAPKTTTQREVDSVGVHVDRRSFIDTPSIRKTGGERIAREHQGLKSKPARATPSTPSSRITPDSIRAAVLEALRN